MSRSSGCALAIESLFLFSLNEIDQKEVQILPLLIQPLVENAISHGLEGITYPGFVRLTITKDGHDLVIVVQDNGSGIPPENSNTCSKNQDALHPCQKNIGLANVNHRVKMFYGPEYGLTIESAGQRHTSHLADPRSNPRFIFSSLKPPSIPVSEIEEGLLID